MLKSSSVGPALGRSISTRSRFAATTSATGSSLLNFGNSQQHRVSAVSAAELELVITNGSVIKSVPGPNRLGVLRPGQRRKQDHQLRMRPRGPGYPCTPDDQCRRDGFTLHDRIGFRQGYRKARHAVGELIPLGGDLPSRGALGACLAKTGNGSDEERRHP
jgi:hypothetical protein